MRKELNEELLENIAGGNVVISESKMMVGFTTTGAKYHLVNCTYSEASALIHQLFDENKDKMSDSQFDALVTSTLQAKNWI